LAANGGALGPPATALIEKPAGPHLSSQRPGRPGPGFPGRKWPSAGVLAQANLQADWRHWWGARMVRFTTLAQLAEREPATHPCPVGGFPSGCCFAARIESQPHSALSTSSKRYAVCFESDLLFACCSAHVGLVVAAPADPSSGDGGPILYRQCRSGFPRNKPFMVIKLRTDESRCGSCRPSGPQPQRSAHHTIAGGQLAATHPPR